MIVESLQGEPIEQYAVRVFESWKLGAKGFDDGLLIIVASHDRQTRIEVGYGLEGQLTDVMCARIIEQHLTPHFRDGDFLGGLKSTLEALLFALDDSTALPLAPHDVRPSFDSFEYSIKDLLAANWLIGGALSTLWIVWLVLRAGIERALNKRPLSALILILLPCASVGLPIYLWLTADTIGPGLLASDARSVAPRWSVELLDYTTLQFCGQTPLGAILKCF